MTDPHEQERPGRESLAEESPEGELAAVQAVLARPNPLVDPTDRDAVAAILDRLARDELTLVGQMLEASNGVFLGLLGDPDGEDAWRVVYKPTRGERPLRDFPPATLAQREVAAFVVSHEGGWHVVPPTVLREGPLGPGSVQLWVDHDEDAPTLVDVVVPEQVPEGWLPVFAGETPEGEDVVVVHAGDEVARRFSAYDCVVNNADRKGSHVLVDPAGRAWGIDHGLTLHDEAKLRTVLWGWVGDPLPHAELERLSLLASLLDDPASALLAGQGPQRGLVELLSGREVDALRARVAGLLATGTYPQPAPGHYPIPWPPL
ncbi:SCO1664 family protein [Arsenicicoccus dermatophilus]|uniref:SCO1664 family protein n=1 Tax=Arsenicicoccus dermatophilus TaxID=1076331 RepID=UPI001F4C7FFB|nr:SCO1664 family protein [Arsenicicoccus dermatophilus]